MLITNSKKIKQMSGEWNIKFSSECFIIMDNSTGNLAASSISSCESDSGGGGDVVEGIIVNWNGMWFASYPCIRLEAMISFGFLKRRVSPFFSHYHLT